MADKNWFFLWKWLPTLVLGGMLTGAAGAQTGTVSGDGGNLFGPASAAENQVDIQAQFIAPQDAEPGRLFITAKIQKGWHINSITQAEGGPLRTEIKLKASDKYRLTGKFQAYPEPKKEKIPEAFGDLVLETHSGTVMWHAPLELAAGADPAKLTIEGQVTLSLCDANSCLPPRDIPFTAVLGRGVEIPPEQIKPEIPAAVTPQSPPPKSLSPEATSSEPSTPKTNETGESPTPNAVPLGVQLGLAFVGGLILNLMPCVLPVISLKILAFLKQGGESRLRVFTLNLWYSAGLLAVFMLLAGLAAWANLSWGEQFTLLWFKVAMSALVFVMALSFLGVWEIPIPGFVGAGRTVDLQEREGPGGAFFKGVFTTILATPCSGPFLGPIFGYLLGQPPYVAYLIFGAVGLGMASPYLLIGAFPELIRVLPKPGGWMKTLEELMGFLLLGTVVYLLQTLRSVYFIPVLAFLIGLWFACWLIGRAQFSVSPVKRITAWVVGAAVAAGVGMLAFTVMLSEPKIPWRPFSPEVFAQARAEGKTVMIDFTANWCPNCKLNSKWAIETDAVLEIVEKNKVVPLLADWTDRSPVIKKALNDLGYNSIPVLAIWPASPKEKSVTVLADVLTKNQVVEALEEAGPSKK